LAFMISLDATVDNQNYHTAKDCENQGLSWLES